MGSNNLKQQLLGMFLQEVQERTGNLERDLLTLEAETDPAARMELIKKLLRDAHSLKGTAGLVEERSIETACHWMEEFFITLRDQSRELDNRTLGLLLAATDAIAETGRRLGRGETAGSEPLSAILPQLITAAQVAGLAAQNPDESRPPQDEFAELATPLPSASRPDTQEESQQHEPAGEPAEIATYLRVPTDKLDALLSECGELLVARYRGQTRVDQISSLQELLKGARINMSSRKRKAKQAQERTEGAHLLDAVTHPADVTHACEAILQLKKRLQDLATELVEDHRIFEKTAASLEAELRQVRMQPFAQACEGLAGLVRDLGSKLGKKAELTIEGGDLKIDRSIIEGLRDLLRHLVRNALDHGLEPAAERTAAGKPGTGRIAITAVSLGDRVQISVADDGRGLNLAAIREQVRRSGIADPEDERDLLRQIFMPGFSTSSTATQVSGRGVGLDIVKNTVESMRGAITVSHSPGMGAKFTLSLPLALTIIRALLVESGGQIFAFDMAAVQRIIRFSHQDMRSIEGQPVVLTDVEPIPVFKLGDWLGIPALPDKQDDRPFSAAVLNTLGREVAVVVDEVLAEQECLLRGLGPRLEKVRSYNGGTILPDGRVALVLNAAAVAEGAVNDRSQRDLLLPAKNELKAKPRVLVADDSITTRTLVKTILETAGYDVSTAADGAEAWQIVQMQEVDVVISDVEMPRMDGFMLTETIRGAKRFKDLPVILVTSRETEQDKARGLQLGADAYLLKSAFDQRQLLETLTQFV